jgi:hypothetical protein
MVRKSKKRSIVPGLIVIAGIAASFATGNPVPFFVALLFVWVFSNRF